MTNELITLKCTSCGKEIQIPAELSVFSCLYCGAKHRMADFIKPRYLVDEADRAYVEEHLLDCIRNFPNYYKQFNRKKYEASYAAHRDAIRETYEAMERYVCAQPAQRAELLESFADSFVDQWETFQSARSRVKRKRQEFADKLTLAWYTIPAIRGFGLSVSEDFPPLLRDRFNARYPDNYFEIGSYEEIRVGFRRHGLLGLFSKQ